jgi:acetyl-CoA carboxylase, biotin carboxylase subunit
MVYLEKFLEHPRHIEFQVLADGRAARCISASATAPCSAATRRSSRRRPRRASPRSSARRWASAASRPACKIGYRGAGTFEFLYQDGEFFFIEMNTRVQVEHPVTEMITGIDIVRSSCASRRASPCACAGRHRDPGPRGGVPHQRRGSQDLHAEPGPDPQWHAPGGPGIRCRQPYLLRLQRAALLRQHDRQAHRHGADRESAIARMQTAR